MARPPLGQESVDLAKERLRSSNSAREIRVCLAVILPTEQGLSINDTASLLGRSSRWISHVRKSFFEHGLSTTSENFGGRRVAHMTLSEEEAFLDSFKAKAKSGGVLEVSAIHAELEKLLSFNVHRSAVYKLLHRHGWRKLAPRKRNTKSDPAAQEVWKKNSRSR
jgi:Transposase and inactivated derivatives